MQTGRSGAVMLVFQDCIVLFVCIHIYSYIHKYCVLWEEDGSSGWT